MKVCDSFHERQCLKAKTEASYQWHLRHISLRAAREYHPESGFAHPTAEAAGRGRGLRSAH